MLVVDLGSSDGLAAAAVAQALVQQSLPIRWGILPANTSLRIRTDNVKPHSSFVAVSTSIDGRLLQAEMRDGGMRLKCFDTRRQHH